MGTSNRRDFLKNAAISGTAAGVGLTAAGFFPRRIYSEETSGSNRIVYRKLGSTGFKVSEIGMGCMNMRDPELVTAAIDRGINYIDTAHGYMRGVNEEVIGTVMKTKRDKVFLTTKVSGRQPEEMMSMMETSLKRLQTDHVDLILLWNTSSDLILNEDIMKIFDEAKKKGMCRFVGISGHSQIECINAALETGFWEAALIPYSYLSPPDVGESIKKAREAGLAVIAMKNLLKMGSRPPRESRDAASQSRQQDDALKRISETLQKAENPLTEAQVKQIKELPQDRSFFRNMMEILDEKQGQALRRNRPRREAIEDIREDKTSKTTPQQALITWVLDNRYVDTTIPGITTFEQLEENLEIMGKKLSFDDTRTLNKYCENLKGNHCGGLDGCTGCKDKCPRGVQIHEINRCLGYAYGYGDIRLAHENYRELSRSNRIDMCADCDECVVQCINGLNLTENIQRARELFA